MNDFDLNRLLKLETTSPYPRSMFGVSSRVLSVLFGRGDLLFFDYILSQKSHWTNIVELGTYYGLTSLYLGICAGLRGGICHTFDNEDRRRSEIVKMWPDNIHFSQADVLKSTSSEVVRLVSRPNTLVFFDNGNKEAEVNMYAKFLQVGSGFIVHDWGTEVQYQNIQYAVEGNGYEPFLSDLAETVGSACRCFIRVDSTNVPLLSDVVQS